MKVWLLIAFHFPFFRLYPSPFFLPPTLPTTHPSPLSHEPRRTPNLNNALELLSIQEIPPPPSPPGPPLLQRTSKNYCFVNHHTHTPKILKPISLSLHTVVLLFSLTLHSKLFMNPCKVSVHSYCCFFTMIPPLPHPLHPSSLFPLPYFAVTQRSRRQHSCSVSCS